jgi:hypothetical protein
MQISYCRQWFRYKKCPTDIFSEAEAQKAHNEGKLYTVLVGNPLRPRCFLEVSAFRSICVEFLDDALRTYFHYSFQEMRPDELFISMSRRPEFPNKLDPPDKATVLFFKTDGRVQTVRYVANPDGIGSKIVSEEDQVVDVTRNWEPYPAFGHYEGIALRDRGSPWLCYKTSEPGPGLK